MARAKRIQDVGYYYISNRSIELRNIFLIKEDYHFFIDYLSYLSKAYEFTLHDYVLLSHSFYILIETKRENLSMIMKLLSRKYTLYFNKKYGRVGTLWEGRYRSVYIEDINYIYYFIGYMESLPVLTGITLKMQDSPYGCYRQFVGLDESIDALKDSIIFKRFNTIEEIRNFFKKEQKKETIDNIIKILSRKNREKKVDKKITNAQDIESYFYSLEEREKINKSIYKAYISGISQYKIAKYLGVTQQAIYRRIKKYKQKNNLN